MPNALKFAIFLERFRFPFHCMLLYFKFTKLHIERMIIFWRKISILCTYICRCTIYLVLIAIRYHCQFTGTPISHTSERSSQNSASSAGSTKQLLPKPTPVQNESTIVKVIPRGGTEEEDDDDLDEDLC